MDESKLQKSDPGESNRQTLIVAMVGAVLLGICALSFLGFLWLQPGQTSPLSEIFPSPTSTRRPPSTPVPTRTLAPNLTATQGAWVRPAQSPSLASHEAARSAFDSGGVYLEAFASVVPDTPGINQPGDVYVYQIELAESSPLLWSYSWCTTTQQILAENFSHIQIEFDINGSLASWENIAVVESQREDGSPCREHVALVKDWPTGQHHLEIRITFTQAIHDGWDLYPAGTHTFMYAVTKE